MASRWVRLGGTGSPMTSVGRALRSLVLVSTIGLLMSACGSEDGGTDGGAGSSSSAGASASGSSGSPAAGTSAAGSSSAGTGQAGSSVAGGSPGGAGQAGSGSGGSAAGSGGSGGSAPVVGEHCTGGDVLMFPDEVFSDFGGPMSNCNKYETGATGIQLGPELSVRDIELSTPLTANQPYAYSLKVTLAPDNGSNTIEIWSADEKCGVGHEELYDGVLKVGILCMQLQPTASHTRLLMVWKGDGSRGSTDIAICPGGSCGK